MSGVLKADESCQDSGKTVYVYIYKRGTLQLSYKN